MCREAVGLWLLETCIHNSLIYNLRLSDVGVRWHHTYRSLYVLSVTPNIHCVLLWKKANTRRISDKSVLRHSYAVWVHLITLWCRRTTSKWATPGFYLLLWAPRRLPLTDDRYSAYKKSPPGCFPFVVFINGFMVNRMSFLTRICIFACLFHIKVKIDF